MNRGGFCVTCSLIDQNRINPALPDRRSSSGQVGSISSSRAGRGSLRPRRPAGPAGRKGHGPGRSGLPRQRRPAHARSAARFSRRSTHHKPLGAYDLAELLGPKGRRLAPITVYRALDFLMEQGLVHRLASQNAYIACPEHPRRQGGRGLPDLRAVRRRGRTGLARPVEHARPELARQGRLPGERQGARDPRGVAPTSGGGLDAHSRA